MIPLYKPYMPELPEIDAILHSGQLAAGKYTKEFEQNLRDYLSQQNVLATSTFNTAISVAITTFDFQYGDDTIVSPMADSRPLRVEIWAESFSASASSRSSAGRSEYLSRAAVSYS